MIKNGKLTELNISIATVFLNTQILKIINRIQVFCCYKNYQHKKVDERLKEQFFNTCKISTHDNNKFILLLQGGVHLYKYMDDLEKANERWLPGKVDFYCHVNMEDISGLDYGHAKKSL